MFLYYFQMKQVRLVLVAVMGLLVSCFISATVSYATFAPNELTIIAIKVTGSESMVIQNTHSGSVDLSSYLVQYYNQTSPASFASPTNSLQLPAVTLLPGQAILLNSDSAATCGASAVVDLSFSLSDSAGYIRLTKVISQPDGSLLYTAQDHANWATASTSSTGADISTTPSGSPPGPHIWYRVLSSGAWTKATLGSDCTVVLSMVTPADTPTYVEWADGTAAPATFSSIGGPAGSASNKGLAAPQITELLPNPAEPLTDAEDEFIELYNPNSKAFDLSGFTLEVGLNTKRKHTFAKDTTLPPKSFKAFSSEETGLALSNSGSQVWLVDPAGTVVAQTEKYGKAQTGQAWAYGNGKWYWTLSPTSGTANIISEPGSKKTSSSGGGSVQGSRTPGSNNSPGGEVDGTAKVASVHPWTLAAVGSMAILYGAYEYRNDLANNLHRLRRYREARRAAGKIL